MPTVSSSDLATFAALDPKQAFGKVMGTLAETDPEVAVVVSDYGRRLSLEHLRSVAPDAVVQVGIAEQDQVEVASALANEGFHVFAPAYAPFITGRALDQVRVHLGMMRSPVTLVGLSAGYGGGHLGATHMALEDLAIMRAIPGITVLCPADNAELSCMLGELAASPRPAYVRITCDAPGFMAHPDGKVPALGESVMLRGDADGASADVTLVASGAIIGRVIGAADALAREGTATRVVEMPCVKPLDEGLLERVAPGSKLLVSVEEHSVVGGLGGAIAEWASAQDGMPPLLRLGCPDAYPDADYPDQLLERAGLTSEGIARSIRARLS